MIEFFPSRTVAIQIFGFPIRWYGLLYLAGFAVAWFLLPRLQKLRGLRLTSEDWSGIVSAAVVGVIVGGRLGYVLFYQPAYYLAHPLEVFAVWKGGMASHGGFVGVTVALLIAMRRRPFRETLAIFDVCAVPIAIGLALGRIGNVINQELYGTVTSLPWGIEIPGVEGLRHPTAVYAAIKDLVIAGLCYSHLHQTRSDDSRIVAAGRSIPGRTIALFLMLYSVLRFTVEFFRTQEFAVLDLGVIALSRGQLLTIPVFIVGAVLWWWTGRSNVSHFVLRVRSP